MTNPKHFALNQVATQPRGTGQGQNIIVEVFDAFGTSYELTVAGNLKRVNKQSVRAGVETAIFKDATNRAQATPLFQGQLGIQLSDGTAYYATSVNPGAWAVITVFGTIEFQGAWNAATNSPVLVSGVGVKGYYYIVSVEGTTNLDGITDWGVGDWAVFNGTAWQKIDNSDVFFLPRELVYAPGAVSPTRGVYNTWPLLMAAVAAYSNPVTVVFDNALGAISIPAGTHTFPVGSVFRGRNTVAQTDVTFAAGAALVGVRDFRMGLRLISASASPVMTFSAGSQQVNADNCNFRAGSTAAFFRVETAATTLQMRLTGVTFEAAASPVVQVASVGASATLNLFNSCNVGANTLAKVNAGTLVLNRDANTVYSATQTGIVGATFTNNLIDLESQIFGLQWRPPAASFATLPAAGNTTNDIRYAVAQNLIYRWTGAVWAQVAVPPPFPPDVDTITHFVWSPNGGDVEPNVRKDWNVLVELMLTFRGVKIVEIDDSGAGPVTMPGNQYNMQGVIFYAKPSLRRIVVNLEKTTFVRGFASEGPIDWVSVADGGAIVHPDTAPDIDNTEIRFAEGSTFKRNGGAELMFVKSGQTGRILLGRNCFIYQGSDVAVVVDDGADFEMQLSDNAVVEQETFKTGGSPNSFVIRVLSPAADFSFVQSNIGVVQPWAQYANQGRLQTVPLGTVGPVNLTGTDFGTQHILGDSSGGDVIVNLPLAADVPGRSQFAKKIDGSGNVVQFLPQGGETIDGAGDLKLLSQYDGAWVYSDGVTWHVTART